MTNEGNITADAVALQERDEFRADGWVKALAPAKVNLHLAIGARRADGYHDAATVMHALNLHDVVYLREAAGPEAIGPGATGPGAAGPGAAGPEGAAGNAAPMPRIACRMVAGDPSIEVPELAAGDNIAAQAVARLAEAVGRDLRKPLELRIEKNIPAQAGLGGGSSDAAGALAAAAQLWGLAADDPRVEQVARTLGADVAFFLHGGCAYLEGTGDEFVHALAPSRRAVELVKPDGGVSTAEAYRRFDEAPAYASPEQAAQVAAASRAEGVALFNNLTPASEAIMPALADVRAWLVAQPHVEGALLSGSGAATFAVCDSFTGAVAVASAARARGWWSRATSFGSIRAVALAGDARGGGA